MDGIRSLAVWNHYEVMYGINPKVNTRWRVMPYAYGDSILTCGEITYQSFGLDKNKKRNAMHSVFCFLVHLQGFEPGTHWLRVSCSTNWAKGALFTTCLLYHKPFCLSIPFLKIFSHFFKNFSLRGILLQNMYLLNWQSAQNKTVKFYVWASGKKAFFVDWKKKSWYNDMWKKRIAIF